MIDKDTVRIELINNEDDAKKMQRNLEFKKFTITSYRTTRVKLGGLKIGGNKDDDLPIVSDSKIFVIIGRK